MLLLALYRFYKALHLVQHSDDYRDTHPWLTFQLSLTRVSYRMWMKLGEAQSKCDHIAGVPLLPYMANEMHRLYLAKGVQATTAIEGNTLTESQVLAQVDGKLKLPSSQEYMARESQNIIDACNLLASAIVQGTFDDSFDSQTIRNLNKDVLTGLNVEDGVIPGELRSYSVLVGKYRGAPAKDCELLLEKLCEFLNRDFLVPELPKIALGLIKAVVAHLYIAWIHPFGDGNGRTSRLMEFVILMQAGVPTPVAHLLSNHYNSTRMEYYRQLGLASQNQDIFGFLEYATDGFLEGLKEQLEKIKKYQRDITWQKYVYDQFGADKLSSAEKRRRDLLIELSTIDVPVPINKIALATPRIANAFAKVSSGTLHRDLAVLSAKGLIRIKGTIVQIPKDRILSFSPERLD